MSDALGNAEFLSWYQAGKNMLEKLDSEIVDTKLRVHELQDLRKRLTKLYPQPHVRRGGRPRKNADQPS